jgi:ATP-dependent DNA helicase PIF1
MSEISEIQNKIKFISYAEEELKNYLSNQEIKLTEKQETALEYLIQGKNVFLTGPAGTGKSLVISLYKKFFSKCKVIGLTSTTGISATLIKGTTLHSYLGIGLGTADTNSLVNKIRRLKHMRKRWEDLEVLIIDEISMLSPDLFDKIEEIARMLRCNNHVRLLRKNENQTNTPSFGGVQLILSGDFLQLPPVKSLGFCFEAKYWNKCIEEVVYFTECSEKELKNEMGIKPTLIYSTNYDVDVKNESELDELCKKNNDLDFYEYEMEIFLEEKSKNSQDIIDKFKKSCLAPENIHLCIGAQVMLIFNLEVESGLANGTRGVVVNFIENLPIVKFLNGEERIIEYHTWALEEDDKKILRLVQIPLKLAWAITTHKSQGMTLDYAEVDLSNVFDYGQAYVALSRVKSKEGLKIKNLNFDCIKAHPKALDYYNKLEQNN